MTAAEALELARNLKFGPVPKKTDALPSVEEAIGIIAGARRTCGFNWITGETAERVLRSAVKEER